MPHEAWKWLTEHEVEVRNLTYKACRGAEYLCDELMEVVYDRIIRIHDLYDASFDVPRDAYMYIQLKWYLWKWMNKNYRKLAVVPLSDDIGQYEDDAKLDTADEVQFLLDQLSPYDRELIVLRHLGGLTYEAMGEVLNVTKTTARKYCLAVEQKLREVKRTSTS